jgi:membrane protease YdiL (CAAX protease family)
VVDVATKGSPSRAATIRLGPAIATWAVGFGLGMVFLAPGIFALFGVDGDDYTVPQLAVATGAAWLVQVAALAFTSSHYGTGDPVHDFVEHYGIRFRTIDLVGIPVGVVAQLAIVPIVYAPLRALWPDTFSKSELEQRARELADKADGWTVVLLVFVVVIGAPIVEELVYRGLLQRSFSAVFGAVPALVVVSIWFAFMHPTPVEWPGLIVAGALFGAGLALTGRIGPGILTHAAFNATGLILALR